MKVNDPNLASLVSTGATKPQESAATAPSSHPVKTPGQERTTSDDVHLSELVRSLRSLAAESPERQTRIEKIARAYADGTYKVDGKETASKVIDDALES